MGEPSRRTLAWAEGWQASWDGLEESLIEDRELRIRALIDVLSSITGPSPTVLDLACGTGSVTLRLLDRLATARSIAVDIDPVLLTIASATFAKDARVAVVNADLRDQRWIESLPVDQVDAVLTASALHWLPEADVRRLYCDLGRLVRPGGVVAHAEEMPQGALSSVGERGAVDADDASGDRANAIAVWDGWWQRASADPHLRAAALKREAIFRTSYPTEEFSPPAEWHIEALRDAGFRDVGVTWRSGTGAVVAGVRG